MQVIMIMINEDKKIMMTVMMIRQAEGRPEFRRNSSYDQKLLHHWLKPKSHQHMSENDAKLPLPGFQLYFI